MTEALIKWRIFKNYETALLAKSIPSIKIDTVVTYVQIDKPEELPSSPYENEKATELSNKKEELIALAKTLTLKERNLTQELDQQKSKRENYNRQIEQQLLGGNNNPVTVATNTAAIGIPIKYGTGLAAKKGFLPWPLTNASVTSRYGEKAKLTNTNTSTRNPGIDLSSTSAQVSAIYEGTILSISTVAGSGQTIIIQHDDEHYSAYSNLESVSVSKGQQVSQAQALGTAKKNASGKAELHFELFKEQKNLNPNHWLKNS